MFHWYKRKAILQCYPVNSLQTRERHPETSCARKIRRTQVQSSPFFNQRRNVSFSIHFSVSWQCFVCFFFWPRYVRPDSRSTSTLTFSLFFAKRRGFSTPCISFLKSWEANPSSHWHSKQHCSHSKPQNPIEPHCSHYNHGDTTESQKTKAHVLITFWDAKI